MTTETNPRAIRFGVYEADLRSGELRKHGIRLKLQEQPFRVLCMLLERPGELVTREELRQRLWPSDTFVDFDHGLNTAVNKLRDVLGDSAANPRFIETLARRGYRFVGPQPVTVGPNAEVPVSAEARNCETAELVSSSIAAPLHQAAIAEPETRQSYASAGPHTHNVTAAESENQPRLAAQQSERLPPAPRGVVRTLLALAQLLYLGMYIAALAQLHEVSRLGGELIENGDRAAETTALITATVGIAVRLYLFTAVAFDYQSLGWKFRRIFPLIWLLDFVWALSPYLLMDWIGAGLATAACAILLYLPFSQRTLVRMAYQSDDRVI